MVDPTGPTFGNARVIRGGSYYDEGSICRSAFRVSDEHADRFLNVGFRVVLAPPPLTSMDPLDLVWIPPGRFLIGSPTTEVDRDPDEGPQTEVVLTKGFWISRYEVTQSQFIALMESNPSNSDGYPTRPVENVTWVEASEFCARLNSRERAAGRLPEGFEYTLPAEAQWEYAARAGTTNRFGYGDDPDYAGLAQYARVLVGPPDGVGAHQSNTWGLFDMNGNVAEWCADWYGPYAGGTLTDPKGPVSGFWRVTRGGSWDDAGAYCRSATRGADWPQARSPAVGFRPVLAPIPRASPFRAPELAWIDPGTFTMGSPDGEPGRRSDEGPQRVVTLTQGFWVGRSEVTQREFEAVMRTNTSLFLGLQEQPVDQVTWQEAVDFCTELTTLERQSGTLPEGYVYRLPTEAEWEYAARAGGDSRFDYGDDLDYTALGASAWYLMNGGFVTHPVGRLLANRWGLYDLEGNVAEWCADWYAPYDGAPLIDPPGPPVGTYRMVRGGSYWNPAPSCRVAARSTSDPGGRSFKVGFRVVLARPLPGP